MPHRGRRHRPLRRVFEPSFSTRFGQGGNGLGLAICHTLVEQVLGGHVHAFSITGQGSRFVVELPGRALTNFFVDRNFRQRTLAAMELTDISRRFIVHWGEMGTNWGVNRSVAQIHALLFVHGRPLHAEDIADTLTLARSNVSNSLKELLNWRLIRVTQLLGDRRDYYETSGDVWELFRTIVRQRKEREFDPTVALLRELSASPAMEQESPAMQDRLRSTLEFMQTLGSWSDEMLRLSPATLEKILRLGAQVQRFVRPADGEAAAPSVFPVTPPMPPMG